jgi:hypothetical protein
MAIRKSSSSGIPFGNTSGRPANPSLGQPYFNGQIGRLELYSSNGWQNIVQETPGVSSASGTYNQSTGSGTFTISGTNFVDGGIAYAVGTNATEYQATTTTYNSIVQMTVLFTGLSPDYEPYDIKVVNPSNLFGLLPDAFYINDSPVWSTSSGSLGTFGNGSSVSVQLAATDDESNALTYAVSSGSLPGGLSLSSSGLISGTMSANPATYTFTISVSDGSNTASTRSFSIIVPAPVVSGGTLSSDSNYYYRTFTGTGNLVVSGYNLNADILTIAGGGAGGRYGGGGGAGGIVYHASQSLSPATTSITVGGGASSYFGDAQSGGQAPSGNPSQFGSLQQAYGGGGGGLYQNNSGTSSNGANGGSGGGGAVTNGPNGTRNAGSSTQVGVGATAFYGNNGGAGAVGAGSGAAGGGGAGGVGGNAGAGAGGVGISIYSSWGLATSTGENVSGTVYYGGGGGGAASGGGALTLGGLGGGGKGASTDTAATTVIDGLASTGGGGGGNPDQYVSGVWRTGAGGSGVVIVRYTKASVGG